MGMLNNISNVYIPKSPVKKYQKKILEVDENIIS